MKFEATCYNCDKTSSTKEINEYTEKRFGEGCLKLPEDFDSVPEDNPYNYLFYCPKCKKEEEMKFDMVKFLSEFYDINEEGIKNIKFLMDDL